MHSDSGNLGVHGGLADVLGALCLIIMILCNHSCAHVLCITLYNNIKTCVSWFFLTNVCVAWEYSGMGWDNECISEEWKENGGPKHCFGL